jgi:hypothetical protein
VQPATRSSRFFCVYGAIGNPEKATFLIRRGAKPTGPAYRPVPYADSRAAEGFGRSGFLFGAVVDESLPWSLGNGADRV